MADGTDWILYHDPPPGTCGCWLCWKRGVEGRQNMTRVPGRLSPKVQALGLTRIALRHLYNNMVAAKENEDWAEVARELRALLDAVDWEIKGEMGP